MDPQELKEWCDFCEGRESEVPEMASRMFMGMFADPLSETLESDLRTILSYIPNSSKTLERLLRIGTERHRKSEAEVAELVIRDLNEMRSIVGNPAILAAMDAGVCKSIRDYIWFREVFTAPFNVEFIHELMNYYEEVTSGIDEPAAVLCDAFYGIACNLHLQAALAAELVGAAVNFNNYSEIYLNGADYSLDASGALVFYYVK